MKKQNLFRVMAMGAICAMTFSLAACGDKGGDDEEDDKPQDINTGILSSTTDEIIIIQDRNVGATEVNGIGDYLTWEEAMEACPEGYALLDSQDYYNDLCDNLDYNPSQFKDKYKWPSAGYYDGTEFKAANDAYYWTSTEWYEDTAGVARIRANDEEIEYPMDWDKTLKMQVRCQKYYPPVEPSK